MRCPRPPARAAALVPEIALAGPYGAGNPEPLLAFPDVRVAFADVVGGEHVKVRLAGGDGARLDAIAFRAVGTPAGRGRCWRRGAGPSMSRGGCAPTTGTARTGFSCSSKMRRQPSDKAGKVARPRGVEPLLQE